MRSELIWKHCTHPRAEGAAFVALGVVGLVTILLALFSLSQSAAKWDQMTAASPSVVPCAATNSDEQQARVINLPLPAGCKSLTPRLPRLRLVDF